MVDKPSTEELWERAEGYRKLGGEANLANRAVAAALRYRAQAPVIDGLMKELGFDGSSLDRLVGGVASSDGHTNHIATEE